MCRCGGLGVSNRYKLQRSVPESKLSESGFCIALRFNLHGQAYIVLQETAGGPEKGRYFLLSQTNGSP
jgi:hypothetical protein